MVRTASQSPSISMFPNIQDQSRTPHYSTELLTALIRYHHASRHHNCATPTKGARKWANRTSVLYFVKRNVLLERKVLLSESFIWNTVLIWETKHSFEEKRDFGHNCVVENLSLKIWSNIVPVRFLLVVCLLRLQAPMHYHCSWSFQRSHFDWECLGKSVSKDCVASIK